MSHLPPPQQHQRAVAYVRLSRPDLKHPGSMEEKWLLRSDIARRIARQYDLWLADDDILIEQVSAQTLAARPVLRSLLERCRAGEVRHIITPYIDRLLRGDKSDEQHIEDTLVLAGVTVYHTEGEPIWFHADYDPTLYEVKSLIARAELRNAIRKRRETDLARIERARWSRGPCPYGYRYRPALYDDRGNRIAEAAIVCVPEEFAVVCEVYRRAWQESLVAITEDLDARAVPPPQAGRSEAAAKAWRVSSLSFILRNPFYAGYVVQRRRTVRKREVHLPPEDQVWSRERGRWEAVCSLEEWSALQRHLDTRALSRGASVPSMLTGILYNWCGRPMVRSGSRSYSCQCGRRGGPYPDEERHTQSTASASRMEGWAVTVAALGLDALPSDLFAAAPHSGARDRRELEREAAKVRRALAENQRTAEDMMRRAEWYTGMFGAEAYAATAAKLRLERDTLSNQAAAVESALNAPDLSSALPLIAELRQRGVRLEDAPAPVRAAVAQALIRRITMIRPTGSIFQAATVQWWDWCASYTRKIPIPDLPRVTRPRRPKSADTG